MNSHSGKSIITDCVIRNVSKVSVAEAEEGKL